MNKSYFWKATHTYELKQKTDFKIEKYFSSQIYASYSISNGKGISTPL